MKKLVTIHSINAISQLHTLADGFIVGHKRFGARLTNAFSVEEINTAIIKAVTYKKEVFLIANRIFDDQDCEAFSVWLKDIHVKELTGIIVADVGAMSVLIDLGFGDKAVYHPETLLTNRYDTNIFASEGIFGAFLAKEITLEEIRHIGFGRKLKLFMVGHGYLDMFYSKRQLIGTFTTKAAIEHTFHDKKNLTLIEAKRDQEPYPILEDDAGTHVFRYNVFHTEKYLNVFKDAIDYIVIDTIFHDDQYAKEILTYYHQPTDALKENIMKTYNETWDEGFLHKPTVYQVKGGSHD